jgi:prolycopene isomerase
VNTPATGVVIRGGKACGVRTASGEVIESDAVVYAGDYKRFVGEILERSRFKPRFAERIKSSRMTEAILAVYLGLDFPPSELEPYLKAHHVFYFPNYDVIFPDAASDRDVHRRMWLAFNYFNDENPDFAPEGHSNLVLQTYSSAEWQSGWENGEADRASQSGSNGAPVEAARSVKRTPAYRALKQEAGRHLIELAENVVPNLRRRIVYEDVGTPLTIERFSLNTGGSTGGWCYDDRISPVYRPLKLLNLFSTPVERLWATGHYTLWPGGVITAALSGKIVANLVAGRRPLRGL